MRFLFFVKFVLFPIGRIIHDIILNIMKSAFVTKDMVVKARMPFESWIKTNKS